MTRGDAGSMVIIIQHSSFLVAGVFLSDLLVLDTKKSETLRLNTLNVCQLFEGATAA